MGMTMTQKILAAHAGLEEVVAGQLISAKLDIVLGNDITTPVAVNEFKSPWLPTAIAENATDGTKAKNAKKIAPNRVILFDTFLR